MFEKFKNIREGLFKYATLATLMLLPLKSGAQIQEILSNKALTGKTPKIENLINSPETNIPSAEFNMLTELGDLMDNAEKYTFEGMGEGDRIYPNSEYSWVNLPSGGGMWIRTVTMPGNVPATKYSESEDQRSSDWYKDRINTFQQDLNNVLEKTSFNQPETKVYTFVPNFPVTDNKETTPNPKNCLAINFHPDATGKVMADVLLFAAQYENNQIDTPVPSFSEPMSSRKGDFVTYSVTPNSHKTPTVGGEAQTGSRKSTTSGVGGLHSDNTNETGGFIAAAGKVLLKSAITESANLALAENTNTTLPGGNTSIAMRMDDGNVDGTQVTNFAIGPIMRHSTQNGGEWTVSLALGPSTVDSHQLGGVVRVSYRLK